MKIFVGIDVGGTFTDYAALADNKLLFGGKIPNNNDYIDSFQKCIEEILRHISPDNIARLTISTTVVTNFITANKFSFPTCVIMPGPGINPEALPIPQNFLQIGAAMDFRGREVTPVTERDEQILKRIDTPECAIIGKFSGRNAKHEAKVAKILQSQNIVKKTYLGNVVSAGLNFPRRVNTTLFYAVSKVAFNDFRNAIKKILTANNLHTNVFFLTSNGGLVNFEDYDINPVETVLSGPVGSLLGAKVLSQVSSFIIIDIGGTTTDFALVLDDKPLFADKGINLNGYPTSVPAFAVYSSPLGGDSPIDLETGYLLSERKGPAMAFGGQHPTLTDALNVLDIIKVGDNKISKAFLSIEISKLALEHALNLLKSALENIVSSWQSEPAYHVWEIKQPIKKLPTYLIGLGGAAQGLTQEVAKLLKIQPLFVKNYEFANAIGTALAKPTVTVSLRADTTQNICVYIEENRKIPFKPSNVNELTTYAFKLAKEKYADIYNTQDSPQVTVVEEDQFNVVKGFSTSGKIMNSKVVIPADVVFKVVN